MPSVLGVDSSTQSTKVEWRDVDTGALIGAGRAGHPSTLPPRSEQDPASWWVALEAATHEALSSAPQRRDVVGIAVGGQQHGMVVLDADRHVIRPAKLWNDTESAIDAEALTAGREAEWANACGSVPVAAFTVTKLAWLARTEPEHVARISHVVLPHDWLTFRLTDELTTDRGDASGTGYWSPGDDRWRPDLLQAIGAGRSDDEWLACLPRVLGPTDPAGTLTAAAAAALHLDQHAADGGTAIVVAPGSGDNMAAALGVALAPGDVTMSLGTSGTVFAVASHPTADPTGIVAGFADATGRFLPLVCTLNATQVTDAVARLLGVELSVLDVMAGEAPLGADGLTLVPYLNGERTPNRPDATGTLAGIRTDVTRAQVARAAYEGVICGLLDGLDALAANNIAIDGRLVLVGGGARSARYRQVLADLAHRAVVVPALDELVAVGAAVQAAAVATGVPIDEIAERWGLRSGTVVDPSAEVTADRVRAVREAYARQRG